MSFLEPRVSFSSNFASLFIVMRHNSSLSFHLNICILWTKGAHQSTIFQTFDCSHEVSFSLNLASPFSVMKFLCNFQPETLYAFDQKSPSMYKFSDFECSNESSSNSSCHFWNPKVRVYSNFASLLSVMKDDSSVFFLVQTSYTIDKNSPSKWNFWTFEWLDENSPNSSCHIWNLKSVIL